MTSKWQERILFYMTLADKKLYHQIHPVKLFTDWVTGLLSLYLLWRHMIWPAIGIAFIPPILISFILVTFCNLETLKKSRFGKYVKKYMTGKMELFRMGGFICMASGAWFHSIIFLIVGLVVILYGWVKGLVHSGKVLLS